MRTHYPGKGQLLTITDQLHVPGMGERVFGQFVKGSEPQRYEQRAHHIAVTHRHHSLARMIAGKTVQNQGNTGDRIRIRFRFSVGGIGPFMQERCGVDRLPGSKDLGGRFTFNAISN